MLGKLLREVQPELMDTLIQATKDGDESRLQALGSSVIIEEDDEEAEETEYEVVEEVDSEKLSQCLWSHIPPFLLLEYCFQGSDEYISTATRWFEGLIDKDVKITNEVYSVHSVEFDRQVC